MTTSGVEGYNTSTGTMLGILWSSSSAHPSSTAWNEDISTSESTLNPDDGTSSMSETANREDTSSLKASDTTWILPMMTSGAMISSSCTSRDTTSSVFPPYIEDEEINGSNTTKQKNGYCMLINPSNQTSFHDDDNDDGVSWGCIGEMDGYCLCIPGYSIGARMVEEGCEPCAPAFYKSSYGFEACKKCDEGTYSSSYGSTGCDVCELGIRPDPSSVDSCLR